MAAGLGFKTFTTGEVLTAADTNGYLMQGVLVFADATARDAAITSPEEGQFAYLKDTNVTTYYTGSAWANLDTTGMTNPMTTTADMIYSSSGSTPARLGIGTAGQVLTVNSGTTAPEWATASSGGMTLLSTTSLSGASTTISSISGSYKNLELVIRNALPSTQAGMVMRFNLDTGTNYLNKDTTISGSNSTYNETYNKISSDQHTSGTNLSVTNIYDYANSTTRKLSQSLAITQNNGTPTFNLTETRGSWNDTSAITSITLFFYTGTISSGTALLYGVE